MSKEITIQTLKSLKSLTDDQAKVLIEIMKKGKIIVKDDMREILRCAGCSDSKTRGYDVIKELEKKEVVIKLPGKEKIFRAIDPRQLFIQCKNSLDLLESEIINLETPSDIYDFENVDPRQNCFKINQEHEIITVLHDFKKEKEFSLNFFYKEKDNKIKFWKEVEDNFNVVPKKGLYNCIIIKHKKKIDYGILLLSKMVNKDGEIKFFGNLIMDSELVSFFESKGVGKK